LTKPRPFYAAVDAMKRDRAAVAELRARYPALLQHAQPCGARAVIEALAPLLTLYGVPDRSEAEWKTFWSLYADPLSAQPLEALRAGVADYVQDGTSEFFPKPRPLRAHVKRRAAPIVIACRRAERVLAEAPA
jgi:hypothetical protein